MLAYIVAYADKLQRRLLYASALFFTRKDFVFQNLAFCFLNSTLLFIVKSLIFEI